MRPRILPVAKACLLLFAVAASLEASAKPEPPLSIDLHFKGQPALGKPATLIVSVAAQAALPKIKLALDLQDGVKPAEQNAAVAWTFDLAAGESREFTLKVLIENAGDYALSARLATKLADGSLRMKRMLYLVIADGAAFSTNISMNTAKRDAIIARYRRANRIADDVEVKEADLPEDVRKELDELNRADAEPAVPPQEAGQPEAGQQPLAEQQPPAGANDQPAGEQQ